MRSYRLSVSTLALLLLAACGDDSSEADVGVDAPDAEFDATSDVSTEEVGVDATEDVDDVTPDVAADADDADDAGDLDAADAPDAEPSDWPTVPRTEAQDDADLDAWAPGDPFPAGEARLGLVIESPFSGPESRCRPGDIVLANENLVACIASANAPNQYTYGGGYLVDIAPADHLQDERLEAILPGLDLRGAGVDSIQAVRDGQDGGAAVLRVSGDDNPLAVISNFVGVLPNAVPLRFETEYRLAPGATTLEVVTWLTQRGESSVVRRVSSGDVLIAGDHVTGWAPGFGELAALLKAESPVWYATSRDMAYGVWADDMTITPFAPALLESEISATVVAGGRLGEGIEGVYTRHIAVARDTEGLAAAFADLSPLAAGLRTELTGPVGEAYPERRWIIEGTDGTPWAVVRLDDAGAAAVQLPPGDYTARLWDTDPAVHPPTAFSASTDSPIALVAPDVGLLRAWVDTPDGEGVLPSPAQVRVTGANAATGFALRGSAALPLPPGTYTVELSRGEEFSREVITEVVVPAGGEVTVNATLTRMLDTTGWVSGDFHQHSARSIDSATQSIELLGANLGGGVDFIAPTDHDVVADYPGLVAELGLTDLLFVFNGTEVSPIWGHMNAFPMDYDLTAPRFGGVALSEITDDGVHRRTGPELAAAAYESGAEFLQINHPREGSAFFDAADYDPVLGPDAADPDVWFDGFASMEVVNDLGYTCEVMRDWFSLLSRGIRVTGVGNSDTHSLGRGPGWPRNYLHVGHDDPGALTETEITTAINDHRVSVSGGLFIDFPDGELPGDTIQVNTTDGSSAVRVRIQSPEWTSANTLVMYVNGIETERRTIDADNADLVDWDDSFALPEDADSYVVFFAYNTASMSAVTPGKRPFGFTNPLFIDVGGDGWTAPGVTGAEDLPTPVLPICD